jgi:hypothetical protein
MYNKIMPLYKTFSGKDKQIIQPRAWTFVKFDNDRFLPFPAQGWSIMEVILRVEYPATGCPTTLRGRFVRWPGTPNADETGHDDKNPIPNLVRHHHWEHFLLNRPNLTMGFRIWHNGTRPIVLDGRQFKHTRLM